MTVTVPIGGCKLGARNQCRTIADESGYCPRHNMMVGEFGETKTARLAFGVMCAECGSKCELELVSECKTCETTDVCAVCLSTRKCCATQARAWENEAESLEDQAEDLRDKAGDLRSGITQKEVA